MASWVSSTISRVKALTGGRLNSSQPTFRTIEARRHLRLCVIMIPGRDARASMGSRIDSRNVWLLSGLMVLAAGAFLYAHDLWSESPPQDTGTAMPGVAAYDSHRRLVDYSGKTEKPCPPQTAHTAIILAL